MAAPTPDALVLGIDLGTTNSRVATFQNGAATLIPVGPGDQYALPSVIALGADGTLLVGEAAKARMLAEPSSAVFGAKRLLGRRVRSSTIRELVGRFPFAIAADPLGDAGVRFGDTVYSLPELYALLLRELRGAAQRHLGRDATQAVLCVPAYFNDHQRAAMREAGKLAGLQILRIFNEPSAVSLAFGYGKGLARKRILVYDLGGGTFDATVVELTGDDLDVVATGGDNFLGGMDFDLEIATELSRTFESAEHLPLDRTPTTAQRLRAAAEQAKITLSDTDATEVHLPAIATRADQTPVDLHARLARQRLEEVTATLVERTVQLTTAVLQSGGLTPQGLDEVLLVGGQSRAPLVRRRLQELAGKPVRTDVDAHAAVALGAAILGHALLQSAQGKPGVTLSEVLSAPIGIGTQDGGMRKVLDRNTRLPAEKTIAIPVKAGAALGIAVFQGGSDRADDNEYLGSLHATADRNGELSLRFAVGADGTLELSAEGPTGKPIEVAMSTLDASDEARAALFAQSPLPGEPDTSANPPGGFLRGLRRFFTRS